MIEKMLLKLMVLTLRLRRESSEDQARMEKIMIDRVRATIESNRLMRENIKLEREKYEYLRRSTMKEFSESFDC